MRAYADPGERVRLESRLHGAVLARPIARASLLAGAGITVLLLGSPIGWPLGAFGAFAIGAGALIALAAVARWDRTTIVLTTDKLLVSHGLLWRRSAAVDLDRAGPIEIEQSILGRLFGYGTVIAGDLEIPYVPQAPQLVRAWRAAA